MNEKMVPIEIPPGIVKNGTLYERTGRWADGNLVRFTEGGPRAIAGATALTFASGTISGIPCGMFAWENVGAKKLLVATAGAALVGKLLTVTFDGGGTNIHALNDVTPVTGWTGLSSFTPATFDRMGDGTVVVCFNGNIFIEGTPFTKGVVGTPLAYAMAVTPEDFLLVASDNREVFWSSQGLTGSWIASSLNTAGSLTLPGTSDWLAAKALVNETLLFSSTDVWSLRYVGPPLVYGGRLVNAGAGIISARAVVADGNTAYWMTDHGFFVYDGYARPLPCDLADEIFGQINATYRTQIFAIANKVADEIWWFWPSSGGTGLDRVAIYNTRLGVWSRGELSRSAGTDAGIWPGTYANGGQTSTVPVMLDAAGTTIYAHEATGVMSGAFLESGPMHLDPAHNKRLRVNKWVPDNNQIAATESLSIFSGEWPKQAEQSYSGSIPAAGGEMDIRLPAGRYIRFRQGLSRADSRIGTPRAGVVEDTSR